MDIIWLASVKINMGWQDAYSSEAMHYDESGTHLSPIALEIEAADMDSNMTTQNGACAPRRPRYAFLVMSEKGGVGKSTMAMTLLDYLRITMSQRVLAIDVDSGNSTLAKSYGLLDSAGTFLPNEDQVEDGVVRCENSEMGFLHIFEALQASDAEHVLLDFPGGAIKGFTGLFPSSASFDRRFAAVGFKPVVIVPFDEQPNQSESVGSIVGRIGDKTMYVVDLKLTPFHGHLIVQQEGVRIVQTAHTQAALSCTVSRADD